MSAVTCISDAVDIVSDPPVISAIERYIAATRKAKDARRIPLSYQEDPHGYPERADAKRQAQFMANREVTDAEAAMLRQITTAVRKIVDN